MKVSGCCNVCEVIVATDMCCGCGVCAAVCPSDVLRMEFNQYGEYVPVEVGGECISCSLCLEVCPFWNQDENEESLAESAFGGNAGIRYRPEIGYYLRSLVGHVSDEELRASRSSGGLATWLQQTYLEEGLADFIISVVPNDDPSQLFRFAVLETVEEIHHSARSAYYPVEMSNVLGGLLENRGRYVVTGLPCFLKGLRLAMRHSPELRQRVVCMIGLVCGQTKSTFFADYLIAMSGGNPSDVRRVCFRHRDPTIRQFTLRFEYGGFGGTPAEVGICSPKSFRRVWARDYFKIKACNYCDDLFAEMADISLMDAWLPEYEMDWRGSSIALVRSPEIVSLITSGIETGKLRMEEVGIHRVLESQHGGLVSKREKLAYRLYLSTREPERYVPEKRVRLKRPSLINRWLCQARERLRSSSRTEFAALNGCRGPECIRRFRMKMLGPLLLYGGIKAVWRFIREI